MHRVGFEPTPSRWKRDMLPLTLTMHYVIFEI